MPFHFELVLVGISESLPGLCQLVSASGIVRVDLEDPLQRCDNSGRLFAVDGHVDLQQHGHSLLGVLFERLVEQLSGSG